MWYDDASRSGCFEPAGTVPEHRRQGLAKAVLCEALRRIKDLGADLAFVSSFTEPAHTLYASIGFDDYDLIEPWVKEWPSVLHKQETEKMRGSDLFHSSRTKRVSVSRFKP